MARFVAIVIFMLVLAGGGFVVYQREANSAPPSSSSSSAVKSQKVAKPKVDIVTGLTASWQTASAGFQNKFQIAVYDRANEHSGIDAGVVTKIDK